MISAKGHVVFFDWTPESSSTAPFALQPDTSRRSLLQFPSWAQSGLSHRCACVDSACEFVYCGGWWDGAVRVVALSEVGRVVAVGYAHRTMATAVGADATDTILASGDALGNCVLWHIGRNLAGVPALTAPTTLYPKHGARVMSVVANSELAIVASGAADGMCHVYSVRSRTLMTRLVPLFDPTWGVPSCGSREGRDGTDEKGDHTGGGECEVVHRSSSGSSIETLSVSPMGIVAVHCTWAVTGRSTSNARKRISTVHVYSINGRLQGATRTPSIAALRVSQCNEYLVTVGNKNVVMYRLAK